MIMKVTVIAVDGPSGTGKGAVSLRVARRLGWHLLDSGALYRLVGLAAGQRGVALEDATQVAQVAQDLDVEFVSDDRGEARIVLEGQDVTDEIRTEAAGSAASLVATLPAVRAALLERQRDFRKPPGLVADGRDMGSVVFPDAALKVFLTASAEARALRRYKQLREKGMDANLANLSRDIAERDARDTSRPVAPLKPAADAVELDTTALSIEEVTSRVMEMVHERLGTLPQPAQGS